MKLSETHVIDLVDTFQRRLLRRRLGEFWDEPREERVHAPGLNPDASLAGELGDQPFATQDSGREPTDAPDGEIRGGFEGDDVAGVDVVGVVGVRSTTSMPP